MLLGKAYSDWGHVSDAVAVYDQLISSHPDDFRGYLAKVNIQTCTINYFLLSEMRKISEGVALIDVLLVNL